MLGGVSPPGHDALIAACLFEQLSCDVAGRRNRFELMDQLVEDLTARPRAISECIEFLRCLHEHPRTRFPLISVGGDGCWEVLSRERCCTRGSSGGSTSPR